MDGADARLLNGRHGCKTPQWMVRMEQLQDSLMNGANGASARLKDEWRLCAPTLATKWSPLLTVMRVRSAIHMENAYAFWMRLSIYGTHGCQCVATKTRKL